MSEPEAQAKIVEAYRKYAESGGKAREHLEYIQHLVNVIGKKFVLVIPKSKGRFKDVPYRVTFKPEKARGGVLLA